MGAGCYFQSGLRTCATDLFFFLDRGEMVHAGNSVPTRTHTYFSRHLLRNVCVCAAGNVTGDRMNGSERSDCDTHARV